MSGEGVSVSKFHADPGSLFGFASTFGGLAGDLEGLGPISPDLSGAGDSQLASLIEELVTWSKGEVAELCRQCTELQGVLSESAAGYATAEENVTRDVAQVAETAAAFLTTELPKL
jgi:hypothetical protein